MEKQLYVYKAKIISIYDGDTVRADIDLGCSVVIKNEPLRLDSINAPEVRGDSREDGLKSRDFLRHLILGKDVIMKTFKDKKGKYGRYIADIYTIEGVSVSKLLVDEGYAVWKDYD